MADSAVSSLLQNLSRLLIDEFKLISGVEDKIRTLSNEFKFIDIFLKSSEGKRSNEFVKELVNQIRDAAHKVEDVVDTYVANANMQRSRNILSKLVHYKSHVMMLHDVDAEIDRIKRSIDEIYKSKDRYNIGEGEFPSEDDAEESLRKKRRYVEEKEVVGLVHDSTFVIKQLKETTSHRDVVSIIGMGGLGKTTLARKIYNNEEVHELFPYRAWGYVSNDYRVKELLLSLLKCLLSTSEYHGLFRKRDDEIIVSESEEEMKKEVTKSLQGKKYLVVLDDIWTTRVWDDIKEVFPDDNKSSRILITSRIKEVAFYTGTTPPYYLPFLNKEEGWVLFSKKVFHGEDCPSNLKDIGTSIVEGCGGLPLAIVVLAGLVAKKDKSQRETWLQIKDHVRWHLAQEDILMDILKLSFNSLPRRLKSCFLYFGIYPEDYEILARQLIQLWMAEGFLQPPEIGTPNAPEQEDIGDEYLNELVDRSLVQVTSHRSDGGVKTCQIHDLLRDLCISESKANKFLGVSTELLLDERNPRRMSVHFKKRLWLSSLTQCNQSHTRSLFLFGEDFGLNEGFREIAKGFKLARVLHFNALLWALAPGGLKTMIHLRYLKIEVTDKSTASDILASICCLWNLESLHFSCVAKSKIPNGIWKLKRLKYLCFRDPWSLKISKAANRETSQNLQTLGVVPFGPQITSMLNNDCFPKLTKLGLACLPWEDPRFRKGISYLSLLSLDHLSKLHTLKITGSYRFDANMIGPKFFASTLTKITLKFFHGLDSKSLGRLPKLRVLKLLEGSTREHSLDCADGEFPQLQVFEMDVMAVKMWRLEKGAMPCLSHLLISHTSFGKLPEQLWCLADLRQVHVISEDESLHNSLQDVKLNNGCKLILSR